MKKLPTFQRVCAVSSWFLLASSLVIVAVIANANDDSGSLNTDRAADVQQSFGKEGSPELETVGETAQQLRLRGAQIYSDQCMTCHGKRGEGNPDHYPDPLTGDATVDQLAELISDTMPEQDPDACVAMDAKAVSAFIHHDFYSEAAAARSQPPQTTLARLTANQLRQSLADLYTHFDGPPWTQSERGLTGQYFKGKHWKKENLKTERLDAAIDFDFGSTPPAEGLDADEYYVHWMGSVLVMETGRYDWIVNSTCAFKLDLGQNDRTFIDNSVQSAGKEEFRKSVFLTAGRCYPIKLQLYQRKRKTDQPSVRIFMSWVPPSGVQEVIPTSHWIPVMFPATFALQTKLPPDDRSYGYDRGTAINRAWDESTTDAAIEFATAAANELYPLFQRRHKQEDKSERSTLRSFLVELVSTAFRRPLDADMQTFFVDQPLASNPNDSDAIKRVVFSAIKSPRFLYPALDHDRSQSHRAGGRLALTLFDSLPADPWLIKRMNKNQLTEPNQVTESAWRMVDDYRCRAKTRELIYHWLDLDQIDEITKDSEMYPGFDARLVCELKASLDAFMDEVIYSDSSDFRQLLQADWAFTSPPIEAFYGSSWKPDPTEMPIHSGDGLRRSVPDPQTHVGVLSHPFVASHFAYHRASSPIHRGVFLTRHALGRALRPPNAAFSPLNPELHPGLTTRQRVHLQTAEKNCQVCHSKINELGFALEHFDAAGRFRKTEKGLPIDASGSYISRDGESIHFNGARELGDFLAGSRDCHQAFVQTAFEHFVKQPIAAYDPMLLDELTDRFRSGGFNIRQLIVWIAEIASQPPKTPAKNNS